MNPAATQRIPTTLATLTAPRFPNEPAFSEEAGILTGSFNIFIPI
jgi:hypothetical protein